MKTVEKLPSFFIIGAPKCGTTALYVWLSEHPNIYMSPVKEPHFLAEDLPEKRRNIVDYRAYLNLFSKARAEHLAVGEGSTSYISSPAAIRNIKTRFPEARLVALVRNPIDMAYAAHNQLLTSMNEDVADFEEAWRLQEKRRQGERIPKKCLNPKGLLYGDKARVGAQLQGVLEEIPRELLRINFFDDLVTNPGAVYRAVLEHLSVPDDKRRDFPIVNESKRLRSRALGSVLRTASAVGRPVKRWLQSTFGVEPPHMITAISRLNRERYSRPPLREGFRLELMEYFREDVTLLSQITGRDLSHWLNIPNGKES